MPKEHDVVTIAVESRESQIFTRLSKVSETMN